MYSGKQPYPPQNVIAIDCDGTLVEGSMVNHVLVEWCRRRKADGNELMLWSARGREYAEQLATRLEITDLFAYIVSKPGYIVDDNGWSWVKYTRAIHPKRLRETT